MKRLSLLVMAMLALALVISGCTTVPPERSVKTYSKELRATNDALAEARERGAREDCRMDYMDAAMKKNEAVNVFWSCRTALAIEMLKEARADAEALCGEPRPMDSDGDGVMDDADKCPNTPTGAKVDARGCWVLKGVNFDTDKSDIKPKYYGLLDEVVEVLRKNPDLKVEVQGHTDNVGSAEYNHGLSHRRATAVMEYLVDKGIDRSRLSAKGYGFDRPAASNDTPEGRATNRRVQLKPIQ